MLGDRPPLHDAIISPMVIWISIRGRIFPKGEGMMRSILWTSPCQESIWQMTRATSIHTYKGESSPLHVSTCTFRGWYTTWPLSRVHT